MIAFRWSYCWPADPGWSQQWDLRTNSCWALLSVGRSESARRSITGLYVINFWGNTRGCRSGVVWRFVLLMVSTRNEISWIWSSLNEDWKSRKIALFSKENGEEPNYAVKESQMPKNCEGPKSRGSFNDYLHPRRGRFAVKYQGESLSFCREPPPFTGVTAAQKGVRLA